MTTWRQIIIPLARWLQYAASETASLACVTPIFWQRFEGLAVGVLAVIATVALGFSWWWLAALFLLFDVSALGYVAGPRVGAWCYNAVHNYVGPSVLGAIALVADVRNAGLMALAWAFHVAVDRALGYGLKHSDAFTHTHLGRIGSKGKGAGSAPPKEPV